MTAEKMKRLEPVPMVRAGIYWRPALPEEKPEGWLDQETGKIMVADGRNNENKVHSRQSR